MKFRKKPVIVVEATQWFKHGDHPAVDVFISREDARGWISKIADGRVVMPGDWVITGDANEIRLCDPYVFAMTYEPVEEMQNDR